MTNDDISGSGDISNKVDTVVFYGRNAGTEGAGHINVTKNRPTGLMAGKKCRNRRVIPGFMFCRGTPNVRFKRWFSCRE